MKKKDIAANIDLALAIVELVAYLVGLFSRKEKSK